MAKVLLDDQLVTMVLGLLGVGISPELLLDGSLGETVERDGVRGDGVGNQLL